MKDELKNKIMSIYTEMEEVCTNADYEISFTAWRDLDPDSADDAAERLFALAGELA